MNAKQHNVIVVAVLAAVLTAGCAPKKPEQNVWDLYDIRYPVPAGSKVPVSRANMYDRYTDNDDYYTPPTTSFGSCGSNNIGFGGCE